MTMPPTAVLLVLVVTSTVKGWECKAGCHPQNGFCEKPGSWRCKPGWQGENCDQCVTFPGCLHGICEKAWQCICNKGWVGSLCDQDSCLCTSRPCAPNATCLDTEEGGYLCICPRGYTGEHCHLKEGHWLMTKSVFLQMTMPPTAVLLVLVVTSTVKGWECKAGCHPQNGFCEKPGRCRCKPGWQGENCDQCVTFPGCLHGICEKAWQCICNKGWVGSLCDQDSCLCTSRPCAPNATCLDTEEGGYLCICPRGYTGEHCHLKEGHWLMSPCQNGGTCVDADSAVYSSCLCPPGFSGAYCEIRLDSCQPNPCLNGGNCTNQGLAFTCVCPRSFTGFTCNDTNSLPPCAGQPCANHGTCVGQTDGTFRCICQKRFTGPTCSLQHRAKNRSKLLLTRLADHQVLAVIPQHYSLLGPPQRDLLKISLKETVPSSGLLMAHGQLLCFGLLALLTCLVILGATGIVFYGRCETWLANAKYSQLVGQQREHLLKGAAGSSQQEAPHSLHIILAEKIPLSSFGRHYTSI